MIPLDVLRRLASSRIASTLAASSMLFAACGPAAQQTPTSAPAAPTSKPAATTAPAATIAAQPGAATQPPDATAPAAGQPKQGGRVIVGEFVDAKTLNPVTLTDTASDVVTTRIFAPL